MQRRHGCLAALLDLQCDLGVAGPHAHGVDGATRIALDAPEREAEIAYADRLADLDVERSSDLTLGHSLTGLCLRVGARRRGARAGGQRGGEEESGAQLTHVMPRYSGAGVSTSINLPNPQRPRRVTSSSERERGAAVIPSEGRSPKARNRNRPDREAPRPGRVRFLL
jgi:hypothetical protein